jgi:hypothetical protein
VSLEAVQKAAADYLHPDKFAILVVGPAEGLDRPLQEYGQVTDIDITIPELEVAQVAASAESLQRGAAIVARAVDAVGGAERLAAVTSLRRSGTAVASSPQGEMQIELNEWNVYPDRQRQEMKLPFGTMVSVVTAEGGFMVTPQGVQDLPQQRLADSRKSMRRQLLPLLRASLEEGFEAVALEEDEIEGRAVDEVQVALGGEVIILAIASDNGEVVAMTYRGPGFSGAPGEILQLFSDFREVDGLSLPHKTDSTFDGDPYITVTATEIVVDGQVEESTFERPLADEPTTDGG